MARPLRIEYEGAVYHVTSRGNARENIYLSDSDREMFLEVLAHVVERFDWICHAYCLMDNHYHLMIETPQANLSRGMRQLNGVYTQRFNRVRNRVGHVFQGRYKSIVIDKDSYLLELSMYIVRNPVAADMVKHVGDWAWSSYKATAGLNQAPSFLKTDWLLSQFASTKAKARKAYQQFVMVYDYQSPWQDLGKADVLGDDTFRTKLQQMTNDSDPNIPKEKLILRHLPLSDIASQHQSRGQWMREAYQEHGYTMQAIADFAGLHHSTVSRFIKKDAKSARNKT